MEDHGAVKACDLLKKAEALLLVNVEIPADDLECGDARVGGAADVFDYIFFIRVHPQHGEESILVAAAPIESFRKSVVEACADCGIEFIGPV